MRTRASHIRTVALILVGFIPFPGELVSLRNVADHDSLLIGTAVRAAQLSEIRYATSLSHEVTKNTKEHEEHNEIFELKTS